MLAATGAADTALPLGDEPESVGDDDASPEGLEAEGSGDPEALGDELAEADSEVVIAGWLFGDELPPAATGGGPEFAEGDCGVCPTAATIIITRMNETAAANPAIHR
jgi:hypothetical protein